MIPSKQWAALRPYEFGESLFGRNWEVRQLRALLVAERIVLLYAPSGAGKTSLIQAGLIPELIRMGLECDKRPIRVNGVIDPLRFGNSSNRYVLSSLISLDDNRSPGEPVPDTELGTMSLGAYLMRRYGQEGPRVVLIFDQFEEVLTIDPYNTAARRAFFQQVGSLLANPRYFALFIIREDFVAGLDPYLKLIPNRLGARFRLDLLDLPSARDAFLGMAEVDGITFQPSAAANLVRKLSTVQLVMANGTTKQLEVTSVEPVHLRVVYTRLIASGVSERGSIDDDDVQEYGDVDTALAQFYDVRVQEVAATTNYPERLIRSWIEQHLITPDRLRGQVRYHLQPAEGDAGQIEGLRAEVIDALIKVYLVRREDRRGMIWLELAHDRLIQPIQMSNATWIAGHTRPFHRQFEAWRKSGQSESLLLIDHTELSWAKAARVELGAEEQEFLDKSIQALARAKARERRTNLADLGWALVLPASIYPSEQPVSEYERALLLRQDKERLDAILQALEPLRALRKASIGDQTQRYLECVEKLGYRTGDTAKAFLERLDPGFKAAEPSARPYILLVGTPSEIPFDFQFELGMLGYQVGRIAFDKPAEYRAYAEAVVGAETQPAPGKRRGAVFAPQYEYNEATQTIQHYLVEPLKQDLADPGLGWETLFSLGVDATRATVTELLGGPARPAVLLVATLGFNLASGQSAVESGAFLTADWSGFGAPRPEHFVTSADLPSGASLRGMIIFLCYGYSAGLTRFEDVPNMERPFNYVAEQDRLCHLPQALLTAGALAIIAHVNDLWNYTFLNDSSAYDYSILRQLMVRLYKGSTTGAAVEHFAVQASNFAWKYVDAMSTARREDLLDMLSASDKAKRDQNIQKLIVSRNNIRNFIILGDPASHLQVED